MSDLSTSHFGPFRGATIVCRNLDYAVAIYTEALGFLVVETGHVSSALAASWSAPGVAQARFAIMGPRSGAPFALRFVEQAHTAPAVPYLSTGWTALEFTVQSSDATIDRLAKAGFEVLGAAEDLAFSKGALRAGQVRGPFGEVLYLTQINRQLDDYTLPHASCEVDRMFIAILATRDLHGCMDYYQNNYGCQKKEIFKAAVPFIARAHNMPADHQYVFGTVELEPEHYIEIDVMPSHVPDRTVPELREAGLLPAGIALVTMAAPNLARFRGLAFAEPVQVSGAMYEGQHSLTISGYHHELIELMGSA